MKNVKIKRNNMKEEEEKGGLSLIKGTMWGYAITAIIFIAYGALLTFTDITEENTQIITMITTVIAMLVSGFISARGFKDKGIVYGMIAGAIYGFIMMMVSFCFLPDIKITMKTLITFILAVSAGGIGGIIGINTKK